jgi:hypothetical protein
MNTGEQGKGRCSRLVISDNGGTHYRFDNARGIISDPTNSLPRISIDYDLQDRPRIRVSGKVPTAFPDLDQTFQYVDSLLQSLFENTESMSVSANFMVDVLVESLDETVASFVLSIGNHEIDLMPLMIDHTDWHIFAGLPLINISIPISNLGFHKEVNMDAAD